MPRTALSNATLRVLLALAALGSTATAGDDSLLSNGDFETAGSGGPQDWPTPEGVTWPEEAGNRFLRLRADPANDLTVYRLVDLTPDRRALKLSFKVRVNDLRRGEANWHDGRIILDFRNADGAKLKGAPHPSFKGSTDGWEARSVEFLVPEGAVKLEVMPALFRAKSGSYDLDDLKLTAVAPAPLIARREAAAAKRAAEIAERAARVRQQVLPAPPDRLPPVLHVEGNKILTADGQAVWLQGVSIPSLEWSAGGENILKSVRVAIDDWNANVVRLCVREDFWTGAGAWQNDGGAGYRQLVDDVINLAGAEGVYVVLDLHRFRAPQAEHVAFWEAVAKIYANHPAVLFELFNEPHDVSWPVWRDGGFVSTDKRSADAIAENNAPLKGFESVGMQALIDAVRRQGAKNLVIAGGLDWSYDLSGVVDGYALKDATGHGIVYSTHVYPWKSNWKTKFMAAAEKYPIFIGECGAPPERLEFIPESAHEDPSTWVPDFLGLVQQRRYHWTAWSFHPKASPCLLSDWDYTPTPYWGAPAKAALSGKRFTVDKLR